MSNIHADQNNIHDLISKEIEGSASVQELKAINQWVNSSSENQNYYNQIHKVNNLFKNNALPNVSTEMAWARVKSKINETKHPAGIAKKQINKSWQKYLAYAASILLIYFIGNYLYQYVAPNNGNIYTEVKSHRLNDGTMVELGKNSALSLIHENSREYSFSGKAKFSVKHDEQKPFIIHIDRVRIMDLGTEFEIEANPASDTVYVTVHNGKVQFFTLENSGLNLEEGEEAIYIKSKNRFFKRNIDQDKEVLTVSFHDAMLSDVMDNLSYSFRKTIAIDNEATINCNLTVDFSNADFNLVKEVIEETLNLKLITTADTLRVTGIGCH